MAERGAVCHLCIDTAGRLGENNGMKADLPEDRLSEYERAVCYNTIPRVVSPVTFSLVLVYAVCLVEAVLALAYGLAAHHQPWTTAGAVSLAGLIVFGLSAFFIRSLVNEVRERYLLALARQLPDAAETEDVPDPFADHVLLKRPAEPKSALYACTSDDGKIRYCVEVRRPHRHWRVRTDVDAPAFDVLAFGGPRSFEMFSGRSAPGRAGVFRGKSLVAELRRRFSWTGISTHIIARDGGEPWVFVRGGIHHRGRLVGRVYEIRSWLYLDVEAEHATDGVLGLFLTIE